MLSAALRKLNSLGKDHQVLIKSKEVKALAQKHEAEMTQFCTVQSPVAKKR